MILTTIPKGSGTHGIKLYLTSSQLKDPKVYFKLNFDNKVKDVDIYVAKLEAERISFELTISL